MRYLYCPECEHLQKRNWYSRGRCENCRAECEVIDVETSIYGKLTYVLAAVAFTMLLLSILHDPLNVSALDLMGDVIGTTYNLSIFVLIGIMFVLTYIDLGITRERAVKAVLERHGKDGS